MLKNYIAHFVYSENITFEIREHKTGQEVSSVKDRMKQLSRCVAKYNSRRHRHSRPSETS